MTIAQLRHAAIARKYGADGVWSTAMHGSAHFDRPSDAEAFAEALGAQVAQVNMYKLGEITRVDWTQQRMPNGYITPIRSESHSS